MLWDAMGIFNHHIESANFEYNKTLDVVVSKTSYVLVTSSTLVTCHQTDVKMTNPHAHDI